MDEKLKNLLAGFKQDIQACGDSATLFACEKKYLGRNGQLKALFDELVKFTGEERKQWGIQLNKVKHSLQEKVVEKKKSLLPINAKAIPFDLTIPSYNAQGYENPLASMREKVEEIFLRLNFSVADTPHIESEYYNFTSLNIPELHPARDMWNTFYVKPQITNLESRTSSNVQKAKDNKEKLILRTHTTAFQGRVMQERKPPFRFINIGRCFRYEPMDRTHQIDFNQLDGFIVDRNLNLAQFRDLLYTFFEQIFGESIDIRINPSYFPFVEPGFEVAIKRRSDKDFLEILGAGFTHPKVLAGAGVNPKEWRGIAFGMGIERLAMIYYNIPDVRYFYSQDLRFVRAFK